jgi:peptide/nickel transport system permease protein
MTKADSNPPLQSVTGVQLAQGLGVQPARGFWADVWSHVLKRNGARFGLAWVGVVAFFAVFSPLIASGHPIWMIDTSGGVRRASSPLLLNLSAADVALLLGTLAGATLLALPMRLPRSERGVLLFFGALQVMMIVVVGTALSKAAQQREVPGWLAGLREWERFALAAPAVIAIVAGATDALGQDVLSQLLHACRLSISIGLVSTGIAVTIGVTIGSLMGYFGGKVDLLLYRVVEIFMAIPVLFLLIVAAAVTAPKRSTYVMMAIIGCVTWTASARFIRAEFMKLRNQDFVQSAKAVGLPLRSILFRHMLPNGVTPVLVDASFAIAAAITIEATLSFLGLGPEEQASWGKLLSDATSSDGAFKWWLAIFPGWRSSSPCCRYNLLGEALRDAIDPKLKKARV